MLFQRKLKILILILAIHLGFQNVKAQVDTSFWFVAPNITSNANFDNPVYFRFASSGPAATVTISQPANSTNFPPLTVNIPANGVGGTDLSAYLLDVENKPADNVNPFGFKISSTSPISAVYEVGNVNNPEIFVLKGRSAIGTEFFIPAQLIFDNLSSLTPPPTNSFEIVATEDNTIIDITPKNDVVFGHPANVTYQVTLNRGETYSAVSTSNGGPFHLGGSKVNSNKPIAITVKDDQVEATFGTCKDLMGDQIVPVSSLGMEYVVPKGNLGVNDRVVIVATEPGTAIYLDGNVLPAAVIGAGDVYSYNNFPNNASYINADKPIYVLHITGEGCEMAQALVPPIKCNGSNNVYFTRFSSQNIYFLIVAKTGSEGNFLYNGGSGNINASAFTPVIGSGGQYSSALINASAFVALGSRGRVTNNANNFFFAVINGQDGLGARYGVFSDFSKVELGIPQTICNNDTITLDGGINGTYLWSNNATTRYIQPSDSGWVWVENTYNGCTIRDSVKINYLPFPEPNLGADTAICIGLTLPLSPGSFFVDYLWNDNSTNDSISVTNDGQYWVKVSNTFGCYNWDTVNVVFATRDSVYISASPTKVCQSSSSRLIGFGADDFQWSPNYFISSTVGDTVFVNPDVTTKYYLINASQNGCTNKDSVTIEVLPPFSVTATPDTTICEGESVRLEVFVSGGNGGPYFYNWDNNAFLSQNTEKWTIATPPSTKTFTVRVWDTCSTPEAFIPITVRVNPLPDIIYSADTMSSCDPILINFTNSTPISASCLWNFDDGTTDTLCNTSHFFNDPGIYQIALTIVDTNGCENTKGDLDINMYPKPQTVIQATPSVVSINKPEVYFSSELSSNNIIYRLWDFGDFTKLEDVINPTHLYRKAGDLTVTLFTENVFGCRDTAFYEMKVLDQTMVFIPKAFTPNGDGLNDLWMPLGNGISNDDDKYELQIFNRWGDLIFETNDKNEGWNGVPAGQEKVSPTGTYLYVLTIVDHTKDKQQFRGYFNLLK